MRGRSARDHARPHAIADMAGLALVAVAVTALHHPLASGSRPLLANRRALSPISIASPPEMPNPTEQGGPLWSLLLQSQPADRSADAMVGEDAGTFALQNEKWGDATVLPATVTGDVAAGRDWLQFFVAVGAILSALAVLWIYSPTGYGDDFVAALEALCGGNSHLVTLCFGILFPVVHSGLAALRSRAEPIVGARAWRVVFASASLPLAYSWIVYYIAHIHDGIEFWNLEQVPLAHGLAWTLNFLSFFLLYPSVFNLKEVAAVEKPKVHLWETGVIRITRHPQAVGQVMWSFAHCAMVGSTFALLTNALLVGHHAFACWHGDRRLLDAHGDAFLTVQERTSVWPFAAVLDGRQTLPPDYYKEFLRAPYALIAAGTLGAYLAHPYMQAGAALVRNTGLVEGGVLG